MVKSQSHLILLGGRESLEQDREQGQQAQRREDSFPTPLWGGRARKSFQRLGTNACCVSTSVSLPLVRKLLMMMLPLGQTLVIHRRITRYVPFLQLECNLMYGDMDFFSNSSVPKDDVQWVPDNGYVNYQKRRRTHTMYPLSHPQLPYIEQGEHRM